MSGGLRYKCRAIDCLRISARIVAGVPLCQKHLDALTIEFARPEPVHETVIVYRDSASVVYYIGHPASQTVKIGTSINFHQRYLALRKKFPGAVMLAVEPGHFDLETDRHRQFEACRVAGHREWFHKTTKLMLHVSSIRQQYGDPNLYAPACPRLAYGEKPRMSVGVGS